MTTKNDLYTDAKRTTERITALNDERHCWVRIEIAAAKLIREYYGQNPQEQQVSAYLSKLRDTAESRIKGIDILSWEAQQEHERVMQKLLERE